DFSGRLLDYEKIVQMSSDKKPTSYTLFRGIMPDWDCTARRINPDIYFGSTPKIYERWLKNILNFTKLNNPKTRQFVFINAWNEWAEGAHLEPDRKFGYAYLEKTHEALISFQYEQKKIICVGHDAHLNGAQILLLNIVKELKLRFNFEVHLILKSGGPLVE